MSRICIATNKKVSFGNNRSKALNSTRRRWEINLQVLTIEVNNVKKRIKLSAKAIRTIKNKRKLGNSNLVVGYINIKGQKTKVLISKDFI